MTIDPTSRSNNGIQNYGTMNNSGAMAGALGAGASLNQTVRHAPARPATDAERSQAADSLRTAVHELQAELARFRAEHPQALADADASDAERAANEIDSLDVTDSGAIGRRVRVIGEVLGKISTMAATVTAVETAYQNFAHLL